MGCQTPAVLLPEAWNYGDGADQLCNSDYFACIHTCIINISFSITFDHTVNTVLYNPPQFTDASHQLWNI